MEKTIEERARETYPKGIGVFTPEGAEFLQKAYIHGATEQKDIDDKVAFEERDNAFMAGYDTAIEEAVKWLNNNARHLLSAELRRRFRNAMEE